MLSIEKVEETLKEKFEKKKLTLSFPKPKLKKEYDIKEVNVFHSHEFGNNHTVYKVSCVYDENKEASFSIVMGLSKFSDEETLQNYEDVFLTTFKNKFIENSEEDIKFSAITVKITEDE